MRSGTGKIRIESKNICPRPQSSPLRLTRMRESGDPDEIAVGEDGVLRAKMEAAADRDLAANRELGANRE